MLFVAIVVTGVVATLPKYHKVGALEAKRAGLERRIEDRRREIAAVKEKQNRFNSDRNFVEALARENRRVFPGELVFIFDK
ncbi:MAG: hypothetical protein MJ138_05230 [Kiritimatiellae bacterium]|nr:hypothetical protein [Kiritimatiellia bacterium]